MTAPRPPAANGGSRRRRESTTSDGSASCRRQRTEHHDDLGYRSLPPIPSVQSTFDTSRFKLGNSVPYRDPDDGTVATAGTYDQVQIAALATGASDRLVKLERLYRGARRRRARSTRARATRSRPAPMISTPISSPARPRRAGAPCSPMSGKLGALANTTIARPRTAMTSLGGPSTPARPRPSV